MTAEEAALASMFQNGRIGYAYAFDTAKLRELGYVIIPVTPSGEALDILLATLLQELGRPHDKVARAAYAAIVGGDE